VVSSRLPIVVLEPSKGRVGFVVNKVALEQVLLEYFGFPCKRSIHRLAQTHRLSSGAGITITYTLYILKGSDDGE
jgi:hypothetical protein